jgi:SAM-dependent methyltransferase
LNLFKLTPPSSGDIASATIETCRSYTENTEGYFEATRAYDGFPGIKEELLNFADSSIVGRPILDLGSGGGRDSHLLAAIGRQVVSGDTCMSLLRYARDSRPSTRTVDPVCMDMRKVPFLDASFGGVWACGSLLHLPMAHMPEAISETLRVLVPGGTAAVSMKFGSAEGWRIGGTLPGRRWFTLISPDDLCSLLGKAGFLNLNYRYVGRAGWFLVSGVKPDAL